MRTWHAAHRKRLAGGNHAMKGPGRIRVQAPRVRWLRLADPDTGFPWRGGAACPGVEDCNPARPHKVHGMTDCESGMGVSLYAFTCGTLEGDFGRVMEGAAGKVVMPVPAFLVEHPKGRMLFDTGLHPDCQRDPAGRLGERMASLYRIRFQPGEDVRARLWAMDRDPARIDLIVNSHFHFDHVGGNSLIPNATMIVQRREWEARLIPEIAVPHGYDPRDFDVGHAVRLVDGEHDVFGDGSVVCMPTFGHTPGHQSLRLRLNSGEVVLAADACYFCRTLRDRRLPRYAFDRDAMMTALDRLRALEAGGARIFFGHDPDFWRTVPQSPAAIR